jgi:FKBP-type peptidyl-prolyl cis-trans isomerase FkpA
MKKRLLILLIPTLATIGCFKNEKNECIPAEVTTKAPDAEVIDLRAFLSFTGVSTTEDPRGFFYTIDTAGTGAKPNTCSVINFDYVTKLLNDSTVDSNTNVDYSVQSFIVGWQEALPLLSAGGSMTLYLPPSLAYGSAASGNIPGNSNLQFRINLHTVK